MGEVIKLPCAAPVESEALRNLRTTAENLGLTGFIHTPQKLDAMRHEAKKAAEDAWQPGIAFRHRHGRVVSIAAGVMSDADTSAKTAYLLDKLDMSQDFADWAGFDDYLEALSQLRAADRAAQAWRRQYGVPS